MTVQAIQKRWGPKAIRKLEASSTTVEIPHIATGFPALDRALGIGGIPRGRITEILGAPTSGMATLALKLIARAQEDRDTAAYLDLSYTFDPDYAARCNVSLERLLLIRPHSGREALEITTSLIAGGGIGVLVFDSMSQLLGETHGPQLMSAALRQLVGVPSTGLRAGLAESPCALVFLTPLYFGDATSQDNYPSGFALPHYATVRLLIEKERWLKRRRDVRGYRARVTVIKNKLAPAGKSAAIEITFNGVVNGNST
jgi:recombination protein RecA